MKIAFLLGGFQNGGIARVTSILANNLCKQKDYDIFTISYSRNDKQKTYQLDSRVHDLFLLDEPVTMKKAILQKGAIKKLRKKIIDNEIDILICCGAIFFILGVLSCRKSKTLCYCWEHTSPYFKTDHKFQNLSRSFGLKHCDKFIILTKDAEKFYKEKFPRFSNKIFQIYNPVDTKCFQSIKYNASSKKILSVGRHTYPKNFERLIRVGSKILPNYPDWCWDIYGEGELTEILKKQIKESGVENQLFLKGHCVDLYSKYPNYSFLVMTSRYEGFPMSLIEAEANRLPIISFDVKTGPSEIVHDGINGFLIDSRSDEEMIKKIKLLIETENIRTEMSKEAFKDVHRFSIEKILCEWLALFAKQN